MARFDPYAKRRQIIWLMSSSGRQIGRVELASADTIEARQYAIDVLAQHVTPGAEKFDPLVAGVFVEPQRD